MDSEQEQTEAKWLSDEEKLGDLRQRIETLRAEINGMPESVERVFKSRLLAGMIGAANTMERQIEHSKTMMKGWQ